MASGRPIGKLVAYVPGQICFTKQISRQNPNCIIDFVKKMDTSGPNLLKKYNVFPGCISSQYFFLSKWVFWIFKSLIYWSL